MIGVNFITTKSEMSGVSRYEKEIRQRLLNDVQFNVIEYTPSLLNLGMFSAVPKTFQRFGRLPWQVLTKLRKDSITHITTEDLSYVLHLPNLKNTVVSCHDLIHWVYYNERNSFFWRLNIAGLKKTERIITVSDYSKDEIVQYLGYPSDKIAVIPNAVDHARYFQKRDKEILKRYDISENEKIILYVGSEQPRMNVDVLFESFAKLKEQLPGIKLLKVGNPQWPDAREKLEKLVQELHLEHDVFFLQHVPEDELSKWYNAADVLVYPCSYAGFGVPPLEAMACGTPVITSNVTSLPEVVGDAGIMVDPTNAHELASAMEKVLTNEQLREQMIQKGLERAKTFQWEKSAEATLKVYQEMAS